MGVAAPSLLTGTPAGAPAGGAPRRRRTPLLLGLVVVVAVLVVVAFLSLTVGVRPISVSVALDALRSYDPTNGDHVVVVESRLPRTLAGLLVGVALGLAGAVMQGLTRNPIADPGVLGVNAGASLAVVLAISLLGVSTTFGYVWFALGGAAVAVLAVYSVASIGRDGATPVKLALAGAAINAACISAVSGLLVSSQSTFDSFRFWQVGALVGRSTDTLVRLAPFVAAGAVIALLLGRALNALSLGDDVARGLGVPIARSRLAGALAVVLLCGAGTAVAGPIAFVGLTVPHVARWITGPDYRWVLVWSALLAPILLLAADVLGRVVVGQDELQVGVVTALLGAPVFIAVVRRSRTAAL